jgi:hypothetical protein
MFSQFPSKNNISPNIYGQRFLYIYTYTNQCLSLLKFDITLWFHLSVTWDKILYTFNLSVACDTTLLYWYNTFNLSVACDNFLSKTTFILTFLVSDHRLSGAYFLYIYTYTNQCLFLFDTTLVITFISDLRQDIVVLIQYI